jgi:hypothetical protein
VDDEQAPKQLIVEGQDDRQAVVELMRFHVPGWPKQGKVNAPVIIRLGGSVTEILATGSLNLTLKTSPLKILGVMLDADGGTKPSARYDSFRNQCSEIFPNLPKHLPQDGLIADNGEKKLGLWIMPDNTTEGGLEAFLQHFVPPEDRSLWNHAVASCIEAKKCGAKHKEPHHVVKANMYSFLSWQDPPGQSPGNAISRSVLNAHSPSAVPFLDWFRKLYGV